MIELICMNMNNENENNELCVCERILSIILIDLGVIYNNILAICSALYMKNSKILHFCFLILIFG